MFIKNNNRHSVFVLIVVFFVILCGSVSFAASNKLYMISMKDGTVLKGQIVSREGKFITVFDGNYTTQILKANIVEAKVIQRKEPTKKKKSDKNDQQLVDDYIKQLEASGQFKVYSDDDGKRAQTKSTNTAAKTESQSLVPESSTSHTIAETPSNQRMTSAEIAKFKEEHKDYVELNGFRFLEFGMSKDQVSQALTENGIDGEQLYDKQTNEYTIDFQANGSDVISFLQYTGQSNTLDQIKVGMMDDVGFFGLMMGNGIVFADTDPIDAGGYPSCKDGEKLINKALSKYKHLVTHNKKTISDPGNNPYIASKGLPIEIEDYVLNYGTVWMRIRRQAIPEHIQAIDPGGTGIKFKKLIVISLGYFSLDKGLVNMGELENIPKKDKKVLTQEF